MSEPRYMELIPHPKVKEPEEFLVVVCIRTDQHDIRRRLGIILEASVGSRGPLGDAQVWSEAHPTVEQAAALEACCGWDVVGSLGYRKPA